MSIPINEKYNQLNQLLDEESYVLVHLNPTNEDVCLPEHLTTNPSVTLKLSRYFRGDLQVTAKEVSAELLFDGEYVTCTIPLAAIWGCTSEKGENIIWPESTPEPVLRSILESVQPEKEEDLKPKSAVKSKKGALPSRGHLRRIK